MTRRSILAALVLAVSLPSSSSSTATTLDPREQRQRQDEDLLVVDAPAASDITDTSPYHHNHLRHLKSSKVMPSTSSSASKKGSTSSTSSGSSKKGSSSKKKKSSSSKKIGSGSPDDQTTAPSSSTAPTTTAPTLPLTNQPSTSPTLIPTPTGPTNSPSSQGNNDCLPVATATELQVVLQQANDNDTLLLCPGIVTFQAGVDPDLVLNQKALNFVCASDSNNNSNEACVWDGTSSQRFMTLLNSVGSSFTGFVFANGFSSGDAGAFGIFRASEVIFQDCTFRHNQAQNGGALFIVDSAVAFTSSSSSSTTTTSTRSSSQKLCRFEHNRAPSSNGGTIYAERATISLQGCVVRNSVAYSGGAMAAIDTFVTIEDTTFQDNFAGGCGEGPAIFMGSTSFPHPSDQILECLGADNHFVNNTDANACGGTSDIAGPSQNCEFFEANGIILGDEQDACSGNSVAISWSGHRIAVGAAQGNFVTVYERHVQEGMVMYRQLGNRIFGNGDEDDNLFGIQVQFDEDYNSGDSKSTIAISALGSNGDGTGYHVKVYDLDTSNNANDDWVQRGATLFAAPGYVGTPYSTGFRTLGGNYVAVGNRVFLWNGNSWEQYGQDLGGAVVVDSIALSQDGLQVAVGSRSSDTVMIYRKSGDLWELRNEIETGTGVFQVSFAQNSTILAVGYIPDETTSSAGRVRVYLGSIHPADGSRIWNPIGSEIVVDSAEESSYNSNNNISMDISSCSPISFHSRCIHLAIGSPSNQVVQVYQMLYEEEDDWTQVAQDITMPGNTTSVADEEFGRSVAISWQAGVVAVGATGIDANQQRDTGAVFTFNQLAGIS